MFVSETNKIGCLAKFMLYAFLHLTEFRVILGSRIVKKHIMYFPYVCNSFMHLVGYLKASGICWTFHIHPNTKEKHFLFNLEPHLIPLKDGATKIEHLAFFCFVYNLFSDQRNTYDIFAIITHYHRKFLFSDLL